MKTDPQSIRRQAIEWMRTHYHVVRLFEHFAQQLVDKNRQFGINLIRERARWETYYEHGGKTYKFRNDFSPYVARHLLALHPEWASLMTCKRTQDETDIVLIESSEIFPCEVAA